MKVVELIGKSKIDPKTDIEPFFKLSKSIRIDADRHRGCFNCDRTEGVKHESSMAWTSVQVCVLCNHVNVVHHQDRMGGINEDVVECFRENN